MGQNFSGFFRLENRKFWAYSIYIDIVKISEISRLEFSKSGPNTIMKNFWKISEDFLKNFPKIFKRRFRKQKSFQSVFVLKSKAKRKAAETKTNLKRKAKAKLKSKSWKRLGISKTKTNISKSESETKTKFKKRNQKRKPNDIEKRTTKAASRQDVKQYGMQSKDMQKRQHKDMRL